MYVTRKRKGWRRVVKDLWWGTYFHHPLCCTLRFAFSNECCQGARRGGRATFRSGTYVPCWWLHFPNLDQPDSWGGVVLGIHDADCPLHGRLRAHR